MKKHRIVWLDIAKGIAIISVVAGHCSYFLGGYPAMLFQHAVWEQLMVPFYWFYCIVGMTAFWTFDHLEDALQNPCGAFLGYWKKKIPFIVGMYILASVYSYSISMIFGSGSPSDFWTRFIRFSVSPPYHFFLTLIQFHIIAPCVVYIVKRMKTASVYLSSLVVVVLFCMVSSRISYYPIYAQPRPLILGGWAFLLFYIGVGYSFFSRNIRKIESWVAGAILAVTELCIMATHGSVIGSDTNFFIVCFSVALLFVVKWIIENTRRLPVWNVLAKIGVYTMGIYIIHWSLYEYIVYTIGQDRFFSVWGFILLLVIGILFSISLVVCIRFFLARMNIRLGHR